MVIMRVCQKCTEPIAKDRNANTKYCSTSCKNKGRYVPRARQVTECVGCSQPMPEHRHKSAKYCTEECKNRVEYKKYGSRRPKKVPLNTKCQRCGVKLPEGRRPEAKFCSTACKRKLNRETSHQNRYGWKHSNDGYVPFSLKDWENLKKRFGYRCAYCEEKRPLERDHVIPLSRGGRHAIANILPACRQCNQSKKDMFLVEWNRWKTSRGCTLVKVCV